ncbi:hypothetical protein [Microcoleus sp. Pol12B4]|uniref:hypothetical protein n=1 Tax=Microcoleus sp. Pol12B4 TaxID=3055395 RepID=UPI002FCFA9A9
MSKNRKPRGVRVTDVGIEMLLGAKARGEGDESKPLTYDRIAELAKVDCKTVGRFFRKDSVSMDSATRIVKTLGLQLAEIVEQFDRDSAEQEKRATRRDRAIEELKNAVEEFQTRMEFSHQAAGWLNDRQQEILAHEATEYVLELSSELKEQFAKDLRNYLYAIHHCLNLGDGELLYKASMKIPLTVKSDVYVAAFKFIEQKISNDLPDEANKQLKFYLKQLINTISLL